MRFLFDEMYGDRVAELLVELSHDAVHVRSIGLGGAPDTDVLARAVVDARVLVTENASDFLPLLDQRQAAGAAMTPVLVALTADRGTGVSLHRHLADAVHRWAEADAEPYAHAHWLP